MRIHAVKECKLHDSFRVQQILGMFDLRAADTLNTEIDVEVPGPEEDWSIGLIIGPSGSCKSIVSHHAFGNAVYRNEPWPDDRAMIDGLGDHPIKHIVAMLSAVGFNSPPSWIRPYSVLSTGEQFRANLTRAFLCEKQLVVFDEFSSSVCRTVAMTSSIAIAKAIPGEEDKLQWTRQLLDHISMAVDSGKDLNALVRMKKLATEIEKAFPKSPDGSPDCCARIREFASPSSISAAGTPMSIRAAPPASSPVTWRRSAKASPPWPRASGHNSTILS